jgi:hypothetical protein
MNTSHHLATRSLLLALLMIVALLLPMLTTMSAKADMPTITGGVTPGALSEAATPTYTFSGTIGSAPTFSLILSGSDLTGAALGWNLTLTSTTLTSGANTLPLTASQVTTITATCTNVGTCSTTPLTSTGLIVFPVTIPAAATPPTAVKFFNTPANTGSGVYTVTPTITVTIPGSAKPGSYTSTYTLTAVSGP